MLYCYINMKARLEDRNKAIELRKQGHSYKEIQAFVRVSKGLLSMWLSDLKLSSDEEKRLHTKLQERKNRGKLNSKILNHSRRLDRERRVAKEGEQMYKKWKNDPLFLMGVMLFWTQGSQSSPDFNFMSKDTDMIFVMNAWVQKYLGVGKEDVKVRIFLPEGSQSHGITGFWAKNLGISEDLIKVSREKSRKVALKNDPFNKGCVRLTIFGVRYRRLMTIWQKLTIDFHGKALLGHRI